MPPRRYSAFQAAELVALNPDSDTEPTGGEFDWDDGEIVLEGADVDANFDVNVDVGGDIEAAPPDAAGFGGAGEDVVGSDGDGDGDSDGADMATSEKSHVPFVEVLQGNDDGSEGENFQLSDFFFDFFDFFGRRHLI